MGKTLDKTKDYGTICGGDGAARFTQGGAYFDNDGDELVEEGAEQEAPKNKGGRPKKVEPETPAVDAELEAQINANLEG